jgi:cytochrome c5
MRVLLVVAIAGVAAVAAAASDARAQPVQQQPSNEVPAPIGPADMPDYCVYGNQIYSLGSGLCIGRAGYICVPTTGPTTGNRAFWTGKDDPAFTRPQCS